MSCFVNGLIVILFVQTALTESVCDQIQTEDGVQVQLCSLDQQVNTSCKYVPLCLTKILMLLLKIVAITCLMMDEVVLIASPYTNTRLGVMLHKS